MSMRDYLRWVRRAAPEAPRGGTTNASATDRHYEDGVARYAASMSVREAREIVEREAARWYSSAHAHSNINDTWTMTCDNGDDNCWMRPRVLTEEHQRIAAARQVLGPRRVAEIDRPYLAGAAEAVRLAAQQRPAEIAARARAMDSQRARQVLTEHTDQQRLGYQGGEMSAAGALDSRDWEAALQVIRREPDPAERRANLRALGAARAKGVFGNTQTAIEDVILRLSPIQTGDDAMLWLSPSDTASGEAAGRVDPPNLDAARWTPDLSRDDPNPPLSVAAPDVDYADTVAEPVRMAAQGFAQNTGHDPAAAAAAGTDGVGGAGLGGRPVSRINRRGAGRSGDDRARG